MAIYGGISMITGISAFLANSWHRCLFSWSCQSSEVPSPSLAGARPPRRVVGYLSWVCSVWLYCLWPLKSLEWIQLSTAKDPALLQEVLTCGTVDRQFLVMLWLKSVYTIQWIIYEILLKADGVPTIYKPSFLIFQRYPRLNISRKGLWIFAIQPCVYGFGSRNPEI